MSQSNNSILNFIETKGNLLFYLLLVLVIIDRANTLLQFSFIYTDSDQSILWLATKDLLAGKFYGPCFYGQNYNPLIEPLLALPLIKAGLTYPIALPLVTSILALCPFVVIAFYVKNKVGIVYGLIPFIILLLLPPEYGMLTSIPRGFVTGIFFGTVGLLSLYKNGKVYDILGSALLIFSFYANPNSILLFPLALPILFNKNKNFKKRIGYLMIGGIIGSIPQIFNSIYYSNHSELIVHTSPSMAFSPHSFVYVITHLNIYFDLITPVFWKLGWVSLLLIVWIGWKLKRNGRPIQFYSVIIFFMVLLVSFFANKISDGRDSVYFSGARMFLAYPIILLFVLGWYMEILDAKKRIITIGILVALAFISFSVKLSTFNYFVQQQIKTKDYTVVGTIQVGDLKTTCKNMLQFGNNNIDLVVANSANSSDQLITYGCGCLVNDFPPTLQPNYDRRTWLLPELLKGTYNKVLIHGEETKVWESLHSDGLNIIEENKEKHWMLIENTIPTKDLLLETNIRK